MYFVFRLIPLFINILLSCIHLQESLVVLIIVSLNYCIIPVSVCFSNMYILTIYILNLMCVHIYVSQYVPQYVIIYTVHIHIYVYIHVYLHWFLLLNACNKTTFNPLHHCVSLSDSKLSFSAINTGRQFLPQYYFWPSYNFSQIYPLKCVSSIFFKHHGQFIVSTYSWKCGLLMYHGHPTKTLSLK